MKEYNTKEILLCDECKGSGTLQKSELIDYHRGEYRDWNVICAKCNGSGRLLKRTITQEEIIPYDNPEIQELLFNKLKEK